MAFKHKSVLLDETIEGLNTSRTVFMLMAHLEEADMHAKYVGV